MGIIHYLFQKKWRAQTKLASESKGRILGEHRAGISRPTLKGGRVERDARFLLGKNDT